MQCKARFLVAGRFKSLVGFETFEKNRGIEISKIKTETHTVSVTKQKVNNNDNNIHYYYSCDFFPPSSNASSQNNTGRLS
jgi:hypothetical protein